MSLVERALQLVGVNGNVPPFAAIAVVLLVVRVALQFVLVALRAQEANERNGNENANERPAAAAATPPAGGTGATQAGAGPSSPGFVHCIMLPVVIKLRLQKCRRV